MKIRFETTIDNVIAFNRFHYANSPTWRRLVWTRILVVPAVLAGLLVYWYLTFDPLDAASPIFVACIGLPLAMLAIAWGFFIRWFMNSGLERNTRKFLAEGSNRAIFGWREMELVDNRLILNTELIHASLDLRAIEKIVRNEQYTFVYISASQAYLIPMNLYPEEEYREFVEELREAWDNRDAPRPTRPQPDERVIASE